MKSAFGILKSIQLVACDGQVKSEEKMFDKFQHKDRLNLFYHFIVLMFSLCHATIH